MKMRRIVFGAIALATTAGFAAIGCTQSSTQTGRTESADTLCTADDEATGIADINSATWTDQTVFVSPSPDAVNGGQGSFIWNDGGGVTWQFEFSADDYPDLANAITTTGATVDVQAGVVDSYETFDANGNE